jgi:hypothetical protein
VAMITIQLDRHFMEVVSRFHSETGWVRRKPTGNTSGVKRHTCQCSGSRRIGGACLT